MKFWTEGQFTILTLAILANVTLLSIIVVFPDFTYYLWLPLAVAVALLAVGLRDLKQTKRAILRNDPIIGHFRSILGKIGPEMRQYVFEIETDRRAFPRGKRAKKEFNKKLFGTQSDVYAEGHRVEVTFLALGAGWCNAARGFMFAVGYIQAQTCHTGHCPTGVTSQDPLNAKVFRAKLRFRFFTEQYPPNLVC